MRWSKDLFSIVSRTTLSNGAAEPLDGGAGGTLEDGVPPLELLPQADEAATAAVPAANPRKCRRDRSSMSNLRPIT